MLFAGVRWSIWRAAHSLPVCVLRSLPWMQHVRHRLQLSDLPSVLQSSVLRRDQRRYTPLLLWFETVLLSYQLLLFLLLSDRLLSEPMLQEKKSVLPPELRGCCGFKKPEAEAEEDLHNPPIEPLMRKWESKMLYVFNIQRKLCFI